MQDSAEIVYEILHATSEDVIQKHLPMAIEITHARFQRKRQLLNPLYVFNACINDCPYCNYRKSNKSLKRVVLPIEDAAQEMQALIDRGISLVYLLGGELEDDKYCRTLSGYLRVIKPLSASVKIFVEAALSETHYHELYDLGADAIAVFQETYDTIRYKELHSSGRKSDFTFRYESQMRAANAGFKSVSFGVLFGVADWRNDVTKMAEHACDVRKSHPDISLTFSFPRIIPLPSLPSGIQRETITEEDTFAALIAFRIAFPDSSLVMTGRESPDFLLKLMAVADTIGYAGSTSVGGYTLDHDKSRDQFNLNRQISHNQFVQMLLTAGYTVK